MQNTLINICMRHHVILVVPPLFRSILDPIINPQRACVRVSACVCARACVCVCVCDSTVCLSVCLCVSVCPAPPVLPLRATEHPTEGTYGFDAVGKHFIYGVFSKTCFVQKLWREKANKLISMCLPRHHMAPMEQHFARNLEDRAFSHMSLLP